MFTASLIEKIMRPLRADGLFLEAVGVTENEFTLMATTYITDTDPEEGDCLCVDPSVQHVGDAPCNVCESFTLGLVQEVPKGSVKCPCCNRYAKPLALHARHRAHVFHRTETGIAAGEGTMHPETVAKIIATWSPPTIFDEGENPAMLVFDVDYTLWPFDCDKEVIAPFSPSPYGGTYDRYGRYANVFHNVPSIFEAAVNAGIAVAIASRNPSAGPVESLLRATLMAPRTRPELTCLWDAIPDRALFHAYSSGGFYGKIKHFRAIQEASCLSFTDMVFFDDMEENILSARVLGITGVKVDRAGLNWAAVIRGINEWRAKKAVIALREATAVQSAAEAADPTEDDEMPPVDINFVMPLRSPFEAEDAAASK
jgi:magnesium-dependent phosphatase-1